MTSPPTSKEILGELERVSEILNNLLSLNTLTRPEQMLFKNLDLLPIAEATFLRHKPLARERRIRLQLRQKPGALAWANPTAVEQIMGNLIKNALLYTPQGSQGLVTITVQPLKNADHAPMTLFEVADSGIGIKPEDLGHIFKPFYRADISRTRLNKKTGSGLGLTIVNEMTHAMGGTVEVTSKKGRGTTVRVLLPTGGHRRTYSPPVQQHSVSIKPTHQGTVIWSPIRAAVTFLRGW